MCTTGHRQNREKEGVSFEHVFGAEDDHGYRHADSNITDSNI
ncbi:MAG: hypothetical protein ACR2GH_10540 [Pseudonocardia sp.]